MSSNPNPIEAEFTLLRNRFQGMTLRKSTRYRCGLATLCHLNLPGDTKQQQAWAANLSETGIGFLQDNALDVGTRLVLRMRSADGTMLVRNAEVIHSTPQADGTWCIGCKFGEPLDPNTLDGLL